MRPTIGRIVYYNRPEGDFPNPVPAIIYAVFSDICVSLWVIGENLERQTSRLLGDGPGEWYWPVREEVEKVPEKAEE